MNSITQEMQFRQSQMQYYEKHGVNELPENTTNVSRTYTFDKPTRMTLFLNKEAQSQKYPMGNQIYGSYCYKKIREFMKLVFCVNCSKPHNRAVFGKFPKVTECEELVSSPVRVTSRFNRQRFRSQFVLRAIFLPERKIFLLTMSPITSLSNGLKLFESFLCKKQLRFSAC